MQTMAFFMDMASWQISSMAIGHLVTSWLLHHIIPGERRAMLSTQVCWALGLQQATTHGDALTS
jgi:hypothetical protein